MKRSTFAARLITAAAVLALLAMAGASWAQAITGTSLWRLSTSSPLTIRRTSASSTAYPKKLYSYSGATVGSYQDSTESTWSSGQLARWDTLAAFRLSELDDYAGAVFRGTSGAIADSSFLFRLKVNPKYDYPGSTTSGGTTVAGFDTLFYYFQISVDEGANWYAVSGPVTVLPASSATWIDVDFNSQHPGLTSGGGATPTEVLWSIFDPLIRFIAKPGGDDRAGTFQYRLIYPRLIR